jgi:hypothetical protein
MLLFVPVEAEEVGVALREPDPLDLALITLAGSIPLLSAIYTF